MDLRYGEEYEAFREEVRNFIKEYGHLSPNISGSGLSGGIHKPSERTVEWQKLLVEKGYTSRTIPKEYGGFGGEPDPLKTLIVSEEFTRAGLSPGLSGQGISMLVPTLLEAGSEEQKRSYVGPTIRGEMIWCQGYSEPGAGSDLASLQTSAREEGDDFIINGQKIWTSSAHYADMMFVLVRTEPNAPSKYQGISYILLSMDTPGIDVRPLKTMTGRSEFNEVFFTDVRVPKSNVVGRRGEGWKVANTTLKHERGLLGDPNQIDNQLYAVAELLKTETVDGTRLIDNPIYRDRLLRLQARAYAMRWHSMRLLTTEIKHEEPGIERLVVKLNGTHLMQDIAALAVDALGELGVLYDGGAHLRNNGVWPFRYMFQIGMIIGGGTSQIQKNIIAERGLGMPREPRGDVKAKEAV
jgi:alkylation response protein AidB-like acyl-CoA dehydrogenase